MTVPVQQSSEELVALGVEAAWNAIWPEERPSPAPGEDFAPTLWRQVRAVMQATGEREDTEIRAAVTELLAFLDGKTGSSLQFTQALNRLRLWTATVSERCR